jgi:hypothetical protein
MYDLCSFLISNPIDNYSISTKAYKLLLHHMDQPNMEQGKKKIFPFIFFLFFWVGNYFLFSKQSGMLVVRNVRVAFPSRIISHETRMFVY